jgi:hypothetical protein
MGLTNLAMLALTRPTGQPDTTNNASISFYRPASMAFHSTSHFRAGNKPASRRADVDPPKKRLREDFPSVEIIRSFTPGFAHPRPADWSLLNEFLIVDLSCAVSEPTDEPQ